MSNMIQLVWLVPLLPLLGFLLNGLFRNQLSKTLVAIIGCGTILISLALSIGIFLEVKTGQSELVNLFQFFQVGSLSVSFSFQVDALSTLFLLIITGVGFLIHLYSTAYMGDESPAHYARYFSYLNLFIFSMLLLVLGSNYVIMFIGWEGVGLCSYLLIGYWFGNTDFNNAAKKAFIMNRIGDFGFLLALFMMINEFGSVAFSDVFVSAAAGRAPQLWVTGITLLLFVGATGKSAQIPLYTWLPDAMAGPTPVSALIHAATMVTAGIYMVARSHALYALAPVSQTVIAIVGLATAFLAATIAIKQNDIKKVLAYSTVSQLGYMFLGLGVGAYTGAVFHVMTHAFFKALLFLGAGSVIHALHHEQDIRKMGGLRKYLPHTHWTFLVACIAISGIPPFSGFFSKDEILAGAYQANIWYWVIGVLTAGLTAFYMFRLYVTTFRGNFRGTEEQKQHLHESPRAMVIPLVILALFSAGAGFWGIPEFIAPHAHALEQFLAPVFSDLHKPEAAVQSQNEWSLVGVSVLVALIGVVYAWVRYSRNPELEEATGLGRFLANKWYVDELYDAIIVKPVRWLARFLNSIVEKETIDWIINGVGKAVQYGSRQVRLIQSGQVGSYVLLMVLSILAFFAIQFFL